MGEISKLAYKNLGLLQGYKINLTKLKGSHHHDKYKEESHRPDQPLPGIQTYAFQGNEFDIAYIEAEPGDAIAWHNHAPNLYQVYIPQQGLARISYYDNDGNEMTGEGGIGDLLYLPPGATNKVEAIGDETLKLLVVERGVGVKRVDQILDEFADNEYDPYNDPEFGLSIDTLRGKVHHVNEEAVKKY